jgi:hypothetical protein
VAQALAIEASQSRVHRVLVVGNGSAIDRADLTEANLAAIVQNERFERWERRVWWQG